MIYFDNAASTPLSAAARAEFERSLDLFANPSSLHSAGFEAERRMEAAREKVARALGASPEEIFFTSGGTESDNLALFGAAEKMRRRGSRVVSTDAEHPAAEECLKRLEKDGFEVVRLSTRGGRIDPAEAEAAINEKTVLLAVMHTNNETGAVFDLALLSRLAKRKNPECLVFSDAVQGFLKGPFSPARLGIDLASLSSHKIHGPKGVGALYVKKGLSLPSRVYGGGQEKGLRSGTENLPGILAFGAAAEDGAEHLAERVEKTRAVKEAVLDALSGEAGVRFHRPENASPHVLSLTVEGFRSEMLLHALSAREIFVSSGSACSSHKGRSPVLEHFGLSKESADSTIRLSFSYLNTPAEASRFAEALREIRKEGY